ncbi:YchJ family protein [Tessaracoccus defluvii]
MTTNCLCDTGKPYDNCCGRWHAGRPAPTAVALMRSRYTAFALENADYLLATWHPEMRPDIVDIDPELTWTGLRIIATTDGKAWTPRAPSRSPPPTPRPRARESYVRSAASSSRTAAGTTTTGPTEAPCRSYSPTPWRR